MTVNDLLGAIGRCLADHGKGWTDEEIEVSRSPKVLSRELRRRGMTPKPKAPRKRREPKHRDLPGQLVMF